MATKKVEEKVNLGKETVEETKKARKRTRAEMIRELKREASKIDIEVMNLTNGSFIYENGYDSIRMNEPGETAIVGLDLLLKMKNSPTMRKLFLSIVDIYSDEYELKDVLDILDLTKIYNDKALTLDYLDEVLENSTVDEFVGILENESPELAKRLCQRAVYLAHLNEFDSMGKRSAIESKFNNAYIFKSN